MGAVRLEQVRKVYPNGHLAVRDVSLQVEDGELFVLVGPSGCGKSTLLRMIAGLETISSGILSIDGKPVNEVAPKDRDIAMVFQNYALYPHMTVAENLAFGLKMRGRPAAEIAKRIDETARMLGLEKILDRRPGTLSGGQRQRVALGRAIARSPSVFLLDEPLSNLDAKLRLATRLEIARLQRKLGATMIYVTHDQIEAMTLGRRIAVLKDGIVQQVGEPMEIYAQPRNVFVAGFFGSPAMNFLRGVVREGRLQPAKGGAPITLGSGAQQALEGRDVVAGLRPEDLQVALAAPPSEFVVRAELEFVESVGNEMFLNLRYGASELVARVRPAVLPPPGTTLPLTFSPERLHFFDAQSGVRIVAL